MNKVVKQAELRVKPAIKSKPIGAFIIVANDTFHVITKFRFIRYLENRTSKHRYTTNFSKEIET